MYSTNKTLFPQVILLFKQSPPSQIRKLCNSSTHNPLAPTPHNLMCGGQRYEVGTTNLQTSINLPSVVEVIQKTQGDIPSDNFSPLVVEWREKSPPSFLLLLDQVYLIWLGEESPVPQGPGMRDEGVSRWTAFRAGWVPFFQAWPEEARSGIIV